MSYCYDEATKELTIHVSWGRVSRIVFQTMSGEVEGEVGTVEEDADDGGQCRKG